MGDDPNLKIDATVMLAQVEDLLNHVCAENEPVHNFVGHSTGGIVAVLAAQSSFGKSCNICKLGLVSPALWASKPLVAQVADTVPDATDFFLRIKDPLVMFAVKDAYIKNTHIAFAKNPSTGEYRYPEAYKKALEGNYTLFEHHPFIRGGIGGINAYFLRGDLLEGWRDALIEISTRQEDPVKTKLIFGTEDVVVDYHSPHLEELGKLEHVEVVPIENQGHESLYENTSPIAEVMIKFFDD